MTCPKCGDNTVVVEYSTVDAGDRACCCCGHQWKESVPLAVVEAAKGKDSLEDAAIEWDVIAQILSTQNFTPAARRCRSIAAALRSAAP